MLKNHSDSILSIMKTINPIHDAFSKQMISEMLFLVDVDK